MSDHPEATHPSRTPQPPPAVSEWTIRVRYAECDPMGVAHHGSYAAWLEEARTEMLRQSGVSYASLEASGFFLVLTKLEIRYRRPIRYDDLVRVHVDAQPAGRFRIRHGYQIELVERLGGAPDPQDPATPADGICSVASTELACVDRTGRPTPLPDWLAEPRPARQNAP